MTFCIKCGKEIPVDVSFCPSCGTPVGGVAPTANPLLQMTAGTTTLRRQSIRDINTLYDWCAAKRDEYERADKLDEELSRLSKRSKARLIWGIIITAFCGPIALFSLNNPKAALLWLFPTILGVGLIVWHVLANKKYDRDLDAANEEYAHLMDDLYNNFAMIPDPPISFELSHPDVIEAIRNKMTSGRADTIKEGINLLYQEAKEDEDRIIALETARAARSAARGATAAAVFAAADWFF